MYNVKLQDIQYKIMNLTNIAVSAASVGKWNDVQGHKWKKC